MGIFSSLFGKKPEIVSQDPVFGIITFDHGIWTFIPEKPDGEFMITVDAPAAGPSDQQRALFGRVRSEVAEYERLARNYIMTHVELSVPVSLLSTYSVQIDDDEATQCEQFVLELSDEEASQIHRVTFRAGQPVCYGIDD